MMQLVWLKVVNVRLLVSAINSSVRSDLSKMKATDGNPLYPEFRFGGKPATLGSQALDTNNTVSFGTETKDCAIVGDFANMFKWGYSKKFL